MEFVLEETRKILRNKKNLEEKLKVKISGRGKKIEISGNEIEEYIAHKVLEAISIGFEEDIAFQLLNPEYIFEKINIKDITKRKNLQEIKARVIGTRGGTIDLISDLSNCHTVLHGNTVYIIGNSEEIKNAMNAIIKLIKGSKQSSVYAYLEKQRKIYHPEDLGLKDKF